MPMHTIKIIESSQEPDITVCNTKYRLIIMITADSIKATKIVPLQKKQNKKNN